MIALHELSYRRATRNLDLEARDLCSTDAHDLPSMAAVEDPEFARTRVGLDGAEVAHGGRILKRVKGMGTVYDWRRSPWTPSNGGRIKPLVFVHHIPVVPNMAGIADFVRLRDVLVAQGLMVQSSTDRDGNVALFTPMDQLCYQARGANQQSTGCEHMHMTLGEEWSKQQLRAAAWLVNQALEKHGIPASSGTLGSGAGAVRVNRRGQVTHRRVSEAAGFFDRTDPGDLFDREYVRHAVLVWRERVRNGQADSKGFEGI